MLPNDRHRQIVEALRDGGRTVRDLAGSLRVSQATIRRDLARLDRNGDLVRTYGGAVLAAGPRTDVGRAEPPSGLEPFADQRRAVAVAAAGLVPDDCVVLLDIGSITAQVARHLRGRPVTVITSSLAVLDELRDDPQVRLVLLGGVLRRSDGSFVGSLTQTAVRQVSADLLLLSCTGVRPNGNVVDDLHVEAPRMLGLIEAADRVALLAPETRFPGTGAQRLTNLADVDVVVTTAGAPAQTLDLCRDAGGQVVVA
jgi:DeoR/GlpR family transcriptional regulator of sugar metabolism